MSTRRRGTTHRGSIRLATGSDLAGFDLSRAKPNALHYDSVSGPQRRRIDLGPAQEDSGPFRNYQRLVATTDRDVNLTLLYRLDGTLDPDRLLAARLASQRCCLKREDRSGEKENG